MSLTMYSDGLVPRRLPIRRARVGTTEALGARARAGGRAAAVLFRYVPESKRHRTPLIQTRGVGRHSESDM